MDKIHAIEIKGRRYYINRELTEEETNHISGIWEHVRTLELREKEMKKEYEIIEYLKTQGIIVKEMGPRLLLI